MKEQNMFGVGDKAGDDIVQSRHPRKKQIYLNKKRRKKTDEKENKNTREAYKKKHTKESKSFNEHYHSHRKFSNNNERILGKHSRLTWKGKIF